MSFSDWIGIWSLIVGVVGAVVGIIGFLKLIKLLQSVLQIAK